MDIITIKELLELCKEQMEKGNGNKKIYLSRDDEGNGYHALYYVFMDNPEEIKDCDWNGDIEDYENSVILG